MTLAKLNIMFTFQKRRMGLAGNRLQSPNIKDARLYSYILRNSHRLRNANSDHRFRRHLGPYFATTYNNPILASKPQQLGIKAFCSRLSYILYHLNKMKGACWQ